MKKIRKSNIAGEILFLLGIIILWQIFYVAGVDGLGIWKAYAMPSPVGVWNSFVEMMKQGTLLAAIGNSLLRGAIGYILSLIIGAVIGILINHFSFLHRNLRPLIMGIQTLPSICWVPIFYLVVWTYTNSNHLRSNHGIGVQHGNRRRQCNIKCTSNL